MVGGERRDAVKVNVQEEREEKIKRKMMSQSGLPTPAFDDNPAKMQIMNHPARRCSIQQLDQQINTKVSPARALHPPACIT